MAWTSERNNFFFLVGRSFFYNMFVLCWCVSVVVVLLSVFFYVFPICNEMKNRRARVLCVLFFFLPLLPLS